MLQSRLSDGIQVLLHVGAVTLRREVTVVGMAR